MKKIINTFLKQKKQKQKGFTLLELLVVVALLSILMSVSLFNYANFGRDVEIENATYTTALAIREVQVFGINRSARKGTYTDVKDTFSGNYRYGFYVEKDNDKLILFRDETDDAGNNSEEGIYDDSRSCGITGSECYSKITLTRGNKITDISILGGNSEGGNGVSSVNISFLRPDPDATIISTASGSSFNTVAKRASRVNITISDPTEQFKRCVSVGYAGDISIKKSCE